MLITPSVGEDDDDYDDDDADYDDSDDANDEGQCRLSQHASAIR